jgi:hypothetical protein
MRQSMPETAAWIDALRAAFGHEDVTLWVRRGLDDGSFYAREGDTEIGTPPAPLNAISLADLTWLPFERIE